MFVELVEKDLRFRSNIVPIGYVDPRKPRDFCAYSSILYFDESIKQHIEYTKTIKSEKGDLKFKNGSVSGYAGNYHCRWVWFDVDCEENLDLALDSARKLYSRLTVDYGVCKFDVLPYFSGGKGFHIGLSADFFGGFEPCNDLPKRLETIANIVAKDIPYVDFKIYNPNRLFRLPNSKHDKTGLYKIPLTGTDLMNYNIEHIKELAKTARTDFKYQLSSKIFPNKELEKIANISLIAPTTSKQATQLLSEFPEDIAERFKKAVAIAQKKCTYQAGERNQYVFYLSAWCNDFGIPLETALELITEHILNDFPGIETSGMSNKIETINGTYRRNVGNFNSKKMYLEMEMGGEFTSSTKLFLMDKATRLNQASRLKQREILEIIINYNACREKPLSNEDVYELVLAATKAKPQRGDGNYGKTMSDLVPEYIAHANRKSSGVTILDFIDAEEENDYDAKVIGIIGIAGSKKSMLLKDILCNNSLKGNRSVYSSMEDTALGQFKRILNRSFEPKNNDMGELVAPEKSLRQRSKIAKETVQEFMTNSLHSLYGDYLIIDEETGQTKEHYEEYMKMLFQKYGDVSILGVDGLSMMDGVGQEWEQAAQNTKDLKELAKMFKLCIPVLIHVPKSASRETRNLWDFARGGAKVLDNVDIAISLSMILDSINSTKDNPIYFEDLVYVAYWGKRTTGKRVDKILRLNPVTLLLEDSGLSIDEFEANQLNGN
jgi:hypothetical protein